MRRQIERQQQCETVETGKQQSQQLNEAMVEWLLNDRTQGCEVCLSPLLWVEGLDKILDHSKRGQAGGGRK